MSTILHSLILLFSIFAFFITALPTNVSNVPRKNGNSGMKRGIMWQDMQQAAAGTFLNGGNVNNIGWFYDWAPDPLDLSIPSGKEFVPMLWTSETNNPGWDQWHQDRWAAAVKDNSNSKHLLGFNEPDQPADYGGTAIPVQDAVSGWRNQMEPHGLNNNEGNPQFYLGSPAISAGGMQWMQSFMQQCNDCTFDFFAAHYYGDCNNPIGLQGYLEYYKNTIMTGANSDKPLWLTEFGATGCASKDQEAAWIYAAVKWLDAQDWIDRYAYFGNIGSGSCDGMGHFQECDAGKTWTCQAHAFVDPSGDADGANMPTSLDGLQGPPGVTCRVEGTAGSQNMFGHNV